MRRLSVFCAFALGFIAFACMTPRSPNAPAAGTRIHDAVGILTPSDRHSLDERLRLFFEESGVDTHFVLVHAPSEIPLPVFAAQSFEELQLGSESPDHRAILFLYDARREQLGIHVSYALEGTLTDGLLGYLVHEHARHLFDDGDPAFGLLLAVRMLQDRFRYEQLAGTYQPQAFDSLRALRHRSSGAGASDWAPIGEDRVRAFPEIGSTRASYAAAPHVHGTFERYLAWLANGGFDPNAGFLTEESRALVAQWPMTPGYLDYLYLRDSHQRFEVLKRGDRAILYSTSSPFASPHLFRRIEGRWQMDLAAEVDHVTSLAGGPYTWSIRDPRAPFFQGFEDEIEQLGDVIRLRASDNRPIEPYGGPDRS